MLSTEFRDLLLLSALLSPQVLLSELQREMVPFKNSNSWHNNFQAHCSFSCNDVIKAGDLTAIVHLSKPTSYFSTYDNMIQLSKAGHDYEVMNKYDIWPTRGECWFQFNVHYDMSGGVMTGYCSREAKTPPTNMPPMVPPRV